MKIGVIADIHGNAFALETVLQDLALHRPDVIFQLGDAFNGPIDLSRVAALLRGQPIIHIRGNGERMVLATTEAERSRSATFARERLTQEELQWIETWPAVHRADGVLACHGSPRSDVEYLLESLVPGGGRIRPVSEIAAILGADTASLVLCAHTHIPRLVQLDRGAVVVNPGSVGLPAYADEGPIPHRMETGSPHARYAVADQTKRGWRVTHVSVPYDFEKAAACAQDAGYADWARALRTGYA